MDRNNIVFFSRCKPQDVDIIDIVIQHKRVFIGHPMAKAGARYNPRNLRSCVVDPSCPDDEWDRAHDSSDKRRQFNQNRNLIRRIGVGSIALVPRPSHGVVYCGRVVSEFELVDSPPWYEQYMEIRGDGDSEKSWHAADVSQSWKLDNVKPIPVPKLPAWIRRSLFGRSTYGVVHPDEICGDPYEIMSSILEHESISNRSWSQNINEIEKRLLEDITPSTFEHLVVSLLQLEFPNEIWSHVGGSGDGGVDGIGATDTDQLVGLVQCKWQYWGEDPFPLVKAASKVSEPIRKYLAALRYPQNVSPSGCIFLDRPKIARLVLKHHQLLPQALSMRVGVTSTIKSS